MTLEGRAVSEAEGPTHALSVVEGRGVRAGGWFVASAENAANGIFDSIRGVFMVTRTFAKQRDALNWP
jgi:hypothetical protein